MLFFAFAAPAVCQYRFDHWTTTDGLPENSVIDIVQTHDSYLWFTTSDGLVRFDGIKFTVFNRENSPKMTSTRLMSLYEDRNHDLWMGTEAEGLMRLHNGTFSAYGRDGDLKLIGSRRGSLGGDAVGTPTVLLVNGVAQLRNGRFERVNTGPFPNNPLIGFPLIKVGDSVAFWSQGPDRVAAYLNRQGVLWGWCESTPEAEILTAGQDEHGTVWLGGEGKLFKVEAGCVRPAPLPEGCSRTDAFGFVKAPKLELACRGPESSLLVSAPDGSNQQQMRKCPLPSQRFSEMAFYRDRENILWIGTSGNGLHSARRQIITTLSEREGLRDHNIYPIYEDRAGAIWIGAWPLTLNRYDHGRFDHFGLEDGLSANTSALFQDRSGRLWVGAYSPIDDGLRYTKRDTLFRLLRRSGISARCGPSFRTAWAQCG